MKSLFAVLVLLVSGQAFAWTGGISQLVNINAILESMDEADHTAIARSFQVPIVDGVKQELKLLPNSLKPTGLRCEYRGEGEKSTAKCEVLGDSKSTPQFKIGYFGNSAICYGMPGDWAPGNDQYGNYYARVKRYDAIVCAENDGH